MDIAVAKIKTSDEQWATARLRWETEPPCNYSDLVEFLDVSRQAIAKRAGKEGWSKQLDMARIVGLAHQKADRGGTAANAENSLHLSPQEPVVVNSQTTERGIDPSPESRHESDQSAAVAARAAVIERHRSEWVACRNLLYAAIRGKDGETIKAAKAAAEAMKKIQEGERDAWDLVAGGGKPTLQIIVERSSAVRVVR